MSFSVVEGEGRTIWVCGDGAATFYKGQIVTWGSAAWTNGSVLPLPVAAGAGDTTHKYIIAGIVTGFDRRVPAYTTLGTLPVEVDGGACVTQAAQLARDFTGQEGMYQKGDPQIILQITEINPYTVIRGPIYTSTVGYGTPPTLLTATSAMTDGAVTAIATNACDFTNVLSMGTIYCRTGVNQGLYRVSKDTSTTAPSVTTAFPYNSAVGDTFVRVPFKQGSSTINITSGMYVDCHANPVVAGTDLFHAIVYRMDLSNAGIETVDFRFGYDHFDLYRA